MARQRRATGHAAAVRTVRLVAPVLRPRSARTAGRAHRQVPARHPGASWRQQRSNGRRNRRSGVDRTIRAPIPRGKARFGHSPAPSAVGWNAGGPTTTANWLDSPVTLDGIADNDDRQVIENDLATLPCGTIRGPRLPWLLRGGRGGPGSPPRGGPGPFTSRAGTGRGSSERHYTGRPPTRPLGDNQP